LNLGPSELLGSMGGPRACTLEKEGPSFFQLDFSASNWLKLEESFHLVVS
jgi:hypothetical protein